MQLRYNKISQNKTDAKMG